MVRNAAACRGKNLQQVRFAIPKRTERREQRLTFPIPALVLGFNAGGRVFQEMTVTRNVSQHGCCFHLDQMPDRDSWLAVRVPPRESSLNGNSSHVLYEIAWIQEASSGWDVGAWGPGGIGIWRLAFSVPLLPAFGWSNKTSNPDVRVWLPGLLRPAD